MSTRFLRRLVAGWASAHLALAQPVWAQMGQLAPLRTIASLDVARYMGTWYEVAKYPNRFQRQCASATQADYVVQANARITVTNRCRDAQGQTVQAKGEARQIGPANSPQLEVRFAPAWLSVLPWVWGDYWVIDLDEAYQLVAVSEPQRQYLWILSRTPQVSPIVYDALLRRLEAQGFDVGKLDTTAQPPAP